MSFSVIPLLAMFLAAGPAVPRPWCSGGNGHASRFTNTAA